MNTPLTREQVKRLPKGFTPTGASSLSINNLLANEGLSLNRAARRADIGRRMNCRSLTPGRKHYRGLKYGRLLPQLPVKEKTEKDEKATEAA